MHYIQSLLNPSKKNDCVVWLVKMDTNLEGVESIEVKGRGNYDILLLRQVKLQFYIQK